MPLVSPEILAHFTRLAPGDWVLVSMAIESEATLNNQERGKDWSKIHTTISEWCAEGRNQWEAFEKRLSDVETTLVKAVATAANAATAASSAANGNGNAD